MDIFRQLKCYTLSDIVGMAVSFLWTKLFFKGALLVRKPFHMRGCKRNFRYGDGFTTGRGSRIELFGDGIITFGRHCHIGDNVHIVSSGKVDIGDDCLLASKIFISDTSHGSYDEQGSNPKTPPNERPLEHSFVKIGKNVWLGENVVILPGVTIGDGCIIGANATVSRDIPSGTIAGGVPARPLKVWDQEKQIWTKC